MKRVESEVTIMAVLADGGGGLGVEGISNSSEKCMVLISYSILSLL